MTDVLLDRPLVVGYGAAGQATEAALSARGHKVTVVDDHLTDSLNTLALEREVELIATPSGAQLEDLVASSSVLLPSPGVGDGHPVFDAATRAGVPVRGEFDLARLWDDRPIVAVTGTNGKTTVTTLVTDALQRSGITAVAAGNNDVPLVTAIDDPAIETFVVEASSFRLGHSSTFEPAVGGWLNFAPDHLDSHASLDAYENAKAKIWAHIDGGIAVANAEDEVVMKHASEVQSTVVTFGLAKGDWRWEHDSLLGPDGKIMDVAQLKLSRPHDLANAAAVSALALAGGGSVEGVVGALSSYAGLPHRNELVGTFNGISWVNDSKATVPQATLAAVGGYESIVLIAGGRNKGVSMETLAGVVPNVRFVVAMGDAAQEVADALADTVDVRIVTTLAEAINEAAAIGRPGDTVLLSPACTSFDAYPSYVERGNHFRQLVQERFR